MNGGQDIIIVGGGPVGATLALALCGYGQAVTVLEARPSGISSSDLRTLALSDGSRLILQRLGVWAELEAHATPITTIHVSQRGRFGRTVLHAADEGVPALGYVLPYAALSDTLDRALVRAGATIQVKHAARATAVESGAEQAIVRYEYDNAEQEICAGLAVLADGGRGLRNLPGMQRETRDYGHHAVVAQVDCELPHGGVAYERFTADGPMALLPLAERSFALVWTAGPEVAAALCDMDASAFLQRLHQCFGDHAGRFLGVSARGSFPLKLSTLRPITAPHAVVIGNAAQTLHPVAGQGFNLGLRDAWELARILRESPRAAIGSSEMLARYRASRRLDTGGGILFTDFLVRTFSNDIPGLGTLRGAGLALADVLAPGKRFVARKMSYGARG